MSYSEIKFRDQAVADGVKGWWWIESDHGAWDGPADDYGPLRDEIMRLCHNRRGVCVQAGGCQGMYPRLWSRYFQTVYTFEPDPLNFHALCLNNQSDGVVKFNCALGDGMMSSVNRQSMDNVGMHTVEAGGHIPSIRLDDLHLDSCDLIQLDVEGSEEDAIRGALRTIRDYKPVISVETINGATAEMLAKLGYAATGRFPVDTVYSPLP